mgnify:CR=1 FL=1
MTNKDSDLIFEAYRTMLYEAEPGDMGAAPVETTDDAEMGNPDDPGDVEMDSTPDAGQPGAGTPATWQAGGQFTDENGAVMMVISPINTGNNGTNAQYPIFKDNKWLMPGEHPELAPPVTTPEPATDDLTDTDTDVSDMGTETGTEVPVVPPEEPPAEVDDKEKHRLEVELSKKLVVVQIEDGSEDPYARELESFANVDLTTYVTKAAMAAAGKQKKPGMLGKLAAGALGTLTPQSKTLGALKSFGQKTATQGWRSGLGIKPEDPYQKALAAKAK